MKDKFIGTSSPAVKIFAACFNTVSFFICYIGIVKAIRAFGLLNAVFAIIGITLFIISIFVSKEVLKNGVKFSDSLVEFTAHDKYNYYHYSDIKRVEVYKNTDASLKKGFVDRYSSLILYMKDGTVATVELGITTKKALREILTEIRKRMAE